MKKVIVAGICGILLVGMTGCGSSAKEELKCTMKNGNSTETIIGTFEKGTLKKMVQESTATYETAEDLEEDYAMAQLAVGMSNAMNGVEGTINKKDLTLTTKITFDFSKMSSENIKDMFEKESMSKEDFQSELKEEGYTCK